MKKLVSITFMFGFWGPTMDEFVRRLKSQKTDFPFELIASYYGKDEATYKKTASLVDKVIRIKPEKHDCGKDRDLACAAAKGDYIVTISVDAFPKDNGWLSRLIDPLIKGEADIVQGALECPEKGNPYYPDYLYWENDYGFYFTSDGESFYKKYGDFGKYGFFGFAAPNLAFKKNIWKKAKFEGARYNEDTVFQKNVYPLKPRIFFKEDAIVLHAHTYKTVKSLFNRCSNEGLGWKDIGEAYPVRNLLKDLLRVDLHIKTLRALARGDLQYPTEIFFHFIRPIAIFWGNHFAKGLYSDKR